MIQKGIYSYFGRTQLLQVLFIFDRTNIFESNMETKESVNGIIAGREQLKQPQRGIQKANMEYIDNDHKSYIHQYNQSKKHCTFIKHNISEKISSKVNHYYLSEF